MTVCTRCAATLDPAGDFCPRCGMLTAGEAVCEIHPSEPATGVCVICSRPFCGECGGMVMGRFLCETHCRYEIIEGMARVHGGSDAVQVEFAAGCLRDSGLHPFVYSRKASPISLGGPDYMLFTAAGEYDGHVINEYKLMVPCPEVPEAERLLTELGIRT